MLLAGDIGGTKTLLGLFHRAPRRPSALVVKAYPTTDYPSFSHMLDAFERDVARPMALEAAAFGVAGPIVDQRARLTNVAWDVSAAEIGARCGLASVRLLNDLQAMAYSVEVLDPQELLTLQTGEAPAEANAAIIAAGTGLGEAFLHRVDGRLEPLSSEGGHADFAPRTGREDEFCQMLRRVHGRAEIEHVLSGRGLSNLHRFTHGDARCTAVTTPDPADISQAALGGTCPRCAEALHLFVSAYGSEAGNLALRGVATGGVFVGGGIAPKILPALTAGGFMDAFRDKAPMTGLLSRVPVQVILNAHAGLIGAAVCANRLP